MEADRDAADVRPVRDDGRSAWRERLRGALALVAPELCRGCATPLEPDARGLLPDVFCGPCERALDLDASASAVGALGWPVHAPLRYAGTGEAWVRRIKYPTPGLAGLDGAARGVMFALARLVAERLPPIDLVVPVPLHATAYRRREINPALLFARALARATGTPAAPALLAKRRPTRPQKGLGIAERRENVADAFVVPRRGRRRLAAGPRILLVDDVVTTGATLDACARALHAGGSTRPGRVACLARTPSLREDVVAGRGAG